MPRSIASSEIVANIIHEKYVKSVPLYRQSMSLLSEGINISRQTMSNWVLNSTDLFLSPIYNLMKEELLKREVLHADETILRVLNEAHKKTKSRSFMWLYRTSKSHKPIVLYDYNE